MFFSLPQKLKMQVKSSQNIYLFSAKTTLSCKKLFWVGRECTPNIHTYILQYNIYNMYIGEKAKVIKKHFKT